MQFNRERIEVEPFVLTILSEFKEALALKKIVFSKHIPEDIGTLWADREKLAQALNYLLSHALKNIQEKGKVTVRLEGTEKYVRLEIAGEDEKDFGASLRKIFDPLAEARSQNQESGSLWISVMKDILELHRGRIWIEAAGECGSKCVLSLPRDFRKKIRIVIADDNPDIRQTLTDILTEKDYLVDTVKNGYELISYLRENNPKVVILDLMMPEKDGTEVFNVIRTIQSNAKVIIYTGFQRFENSPYARSAERFIMKDDNPEKLLQAIEELV